MFKVFFVGIFALFLSSCATVGEQTKAVLLSPPDIPSHEEIGTVPFVKQTSGYCGPSALTMVMQWAGHPISVESLTPEVYTPGKKGTLQLDLVSASRRHGLLAIPIEGMVSLLREVAAGHPVIVLENLGLSWFPQWHYSVVVGYDLKDQELIMHSGDNAFSRLSLNYFEHGWKLGDYWGLVVLPATQLSVTADELDHLKAAVGIEQANLPEDAEQAYKSILRRWPNSLAALIGLGNLAYQKKDYSWAVIYLNLATRLHPESLAAQHNLAIAKNARK